MQQAPHGAQGYALTGAHITKGLFMYKVAELKYFLIVSIVLLLSVVVVVVCNELGLANPLHTMQDRLLAACGVICVALVQPFVVLDTNAL